MNEKQRDQILLEILNKSNNLDNAIEKLSENQAIVIEKTNTIEKNISTLDNQV